MMKTLCAKIAVVLTLATLSGNVYAQNQIPEICHTLYDKFTQSETWDKAGETAWRMMEENCWPSIQNPITTQSDLSNVTDCASLEPYIIDLMQNENPHIITFHGMKEITPSDKDRIAISLMSQGRLNELKNLNPPSGVSRLVDCFGDARYSDGIRAIRIYLEKDDTTGELYYGVIPIS